MAYNTNQIYEIFHTGLECIWSDLKSEHGTASGICKYMLRSLKEASGDERVWARSILQAIWEEWPTYSGCNIFPVPADPDSGMEPDVRYVSTSEDDLFAMNTYYGAMRLDLLTFLITKVEQYLISNNIQFKPIGGSNHD